MKSQIAFWIAVFLVNSLNAAAGWVKIPAPALPPAKASLLHNSLFNPTELSSEESQSWKFTVGVQTDSSVCTAVLLNSRLLLTAKHCFEGGEANLYLNFYWGSELFETKTFTTGSFQIRSHPSKDVALISLSDDAQPDESYQPAQFMTISSGMLYGSKFYIAGNGWNNKRKLAGDHLGFIQGNYFRQADLGQIEIQIGNGQGVCGGDSGGPVMQMVDGSLVVVGITNRSSANLVPKQKCGNYLYFTPINEELERWIMGHW